MTADTSTVPIHTLLRAMVLFAVLVVSVAGCSSDVDTNGEPAPQSWRGVSRTGVFQVQFAPREGVAPIAQFHDWTILLHDAAGDPVYPARIRIASGMPDHGHGMPTQPQVTEYLGDGRYLVEGMKFNMAGAWLFYITIETEVARDRVEIAIDLTI